MEAQFLGMLKGDPANAVNNAFWCARRAAGIEDIEGIVEADAHKFFKWCALFGLFKQEGAGQTGKVGAVGEEWNNEASGDRRHRSGKLAYDLQPVEPLAGIIVTVAGDQQFRLNLAKAILSPAKAEIRRTAGKNRAHRSVSLIHI